MKHRQLLAAAIALLLPCAGAWAADQSIVRAGEQASVAGPAEFFTGRVRIDPVWAAGQGIDASGALVTFEPGARSAWHTHPAGQRLVVTAGVGRTQQWGQPVQVLRPGDVVWCPPGVKHWHGAAPGTAMTHLAVTGTADGRNVQWMEKVSDEPAASPRAPAAVTPDRPALTPRQQAIAPIAAQAAVGDMVALHAALNQGLDAGLSISETREILVQLYAYAGFPRSLNALAALMQVLDERRQRGLHDEPGREAGPVPTGNELLALGTANQTRLVGAPVRGPLFDFAPAIDQYLKSHLFGALFARDNLDWPSRELATVGALAAMPGVESQLLSHIRFSMNVGLSEAQLRQAAQALATSGRPDAAGRARAAIDQQAAGGNR